MTAFEAYLAEHGRALYRFAVVLCGDPVNADELTGDTLSHAYEKWDQVGAATNVHAYVRKMLLNRHLNWRRALQRTHPVADLSELMPAVADHSERYAERSALVARLASLPRAQRAALVLRYYEDLSYAEIAEQLATSEVSARVSVSRALKTLRAQASDEVMRR